jgi:hypothetical protein
VLSRGRRNTGANGAGKVRRWRPTVSSIGAYSWGFGGLLMRVTSRTNDLNLCRCKERSGRNNAVNRHSVWSMVALTLESACCPSVTVLNGGKHRHVGDTCSVVKRMNAAAFASENVICVLEEGVKMMQRSSCCIMMEPFCTSTCKKLNRKHV